ncbi:hypothetical protein P775_25315 [Puniceibacterium antarcticum]|uniref:Uncharacterized protein n=1 Tax=Puniceibacterium antarcticum TaxID=1206336 RepID=A0A2G8R423_9RHOB|nr:hypothetical protein P775_25315 [Puniceibacterium antarcticum]
MTFFQQGDMICIFLDTCMIQLLDRQRSVAAKVKLKAKPRHSLVFSTMATIDQIEFKDIP